MSLGQFGPSPALSLEVLGGIPARTVIAQARELGYPAIGISAVRSEFSPAALGVSGARDLAVYLARNNLAVCWVSAGPRGRFSVSQALDEDIARARAVVELAGRLRAGAACVRVGAIGARDSEAAANLGQALRELAAAADGVGVSLALLPSPGEGHLIEGVLSGLVDAPVGRMIDPGAALFAGMDPVDEVALAGKVTAVRASDSSAESADLAPGEGRVPWRDFLAALGVADYHGYVTVEFAGRTDAPGRAAKALSMLRAYTIS